MKAVNRSVFIWMLVILAYSIPCTTPTSTGCKGRYWEEIVISQGNLITRLKYIGKEYKVAFDLEINSYGSGWNQVVQFTTGGDCCEYGQRSPSVFTYEADIFHITSAVNGNGNYAKNFPHDPQDNKYHIEISQTLNDNKYWYNIAMNHVSVFTVENTDAQKFEDVQMWAADTLSAGDPALYGILRNVCVDI
eukprot:GFUD01100405.1.p1 GENE.GFUD01100405.1~~GFUD01100405.1.p1  ORF type:complete len:191 (-),score=20.53 GFUD01100405.1:645-1217(-)